MAHIRQKYKRTEANGISCCGYSLSGILGTGVINLSTYLRKMYAFLKQEVKKDKLGPLPFITNIMTATTFSSCTKQGYHLLMAENQQ